jgi:predicted GH43/DUF377 family glycosyl hydrolase
MPNRNSRMHSNSPSRILLAILPAVVATGCHGGGGGGHAPAAGFAITPTTGLATAEEGGSATFSVALNRAPKADVTLDLVSSDPAEGAPATASLTFTAANWSIPQVVSVDGVDDLVDDGDKGYSIVTSAAVSADPAYAGLDPADVSVTNGDDDTAGITVTPTSGLSTNESGGTAEFTVRLDSLPMADVTISVESSNPLEGTASPAVLTFSSQDGMTPQTVTITGVDDGSNADGPVGLTVVLGSGVSADLLYDGLDPVDVSVTNNDNDSAGFTVTPTSAPATTESGGTATLSIVCNTMPAADVMVSIQSDDPAEGTASTAMLTFTSSNGMTPQVVTITGVDDFVDDGDAGYAILTGDAASADPAYDGLALADLALSNQDDDVAGISVFPGGPFDPVSGGLLTTESGGAVTFEVVLDSEPIADVTVGLSSSDLAEASVSPASVTFSVLDWDVAQVVTVTGADDAVADGNRAYSIVLAPAASADAGYGSMDAADLDCVNEDNETPGVFITPLAGLITTESAGSDSFSVHLTSVPTASVVLNLSSSSPEGTVSPASLTFLPGDALVPQLVTVTGTDDTAADGPKAYTIVTAPCVSADPAYAGIDPSDVACTNQDNENPPEGAGPFAKDAASPVLATGNGNAFDAAQVSDPSVLLDGTFVMWYQARNAMGQKHERVGRATSLDGITWTKEGLVFSHSGVNGSFDRDGVLQPTVLFDGATYWMWYAGRTNGKPSRIGMATSDDGIVWTRANGGAPVLGGTAGKFDSNGVSNPAVIQDGGVFRMWYTGRSASGVLRIGCAESADGIAWVKQNGGNAVLGTGTGGFDAAGASACSVIQDDGTLRMWYAGLNSANGGKLRIGFAQSSDGIAWTKFAGNPVITPGAAGQFDAAQVTSPCAVLDGSSYKLWYTGQNAAGTNRIGLATAP